MITVSSEKKVFLKEDSFLQLKVEKENKYFFLDINFYSDKFKEYQKELFSEFFSKVLELQESTQNFLDFKKQLESHIKQFNTNLKVFAEKLNLENKIEIRWGLQIIWDEYYIAWLIWETSLIIFRNEKLESVIVNEIDLEDKIDIFSEIIEGELENNDKIIQVACNIYNYLTDSEIKEIINTDSDIITTLEEILTTRVEPKEFGFIQIIEFYQKIIKQEIKKPEFEKYKKVIQKYKYPIAISAGIIIILFLIIWFFSYISNDNQATIVINWQKITTNLDDIKREIDAFSKLENTNTTVAKQQYDKIMKQLSELEKNNIQVLEVKELKKKMEQLYFKWFHINIVSENDWILTKVYSFSDKELQELSGAKWIVYENGFLNVFGEKGVLLNIINNKTKALSLNLTLPTQINTCSKNLANNWLYCVLKNNDIYNFSKYWISSLTNSDQKWPSNIIDLGTYGINKLYLLTKDPNLNKNNTFITRYVLRIWNKFWKVSYYTLADNTDKKILNWIFTGSTFAIDGTFLIWTKEWLVQAYRKNYYDTKMQARIIKWWEKWVINKDKDFTWKVKVISLPNDKYIYLYDYSTNSLVVYLTSPYKTNDAYSTSYSLIYKYKIKFALTNSKALDVDIHYNPAQDERIVYLLTNKWIYKFNLSEFNE